jgi:ubiquinone/menaquinone biosynthesis C-methylase UbiE
MVLRDQGRATIGTMTDEEVVDSGADESSRIRAVFEERDRRRERPQAVVEAYRRMNAERIAKTRALIARLLPAPYPSILDVGCGAGYDLSRFLADGWPADRLAGVDLVESRIEHARETCPGVRFEVNEGSSLPFPTASFDVSTAAVVFSSILDDAIRRELFAEMERVTRPGGIVLVYDFVIRNPRNPDVIGMDRPRLAALGRRPTGSQRLSPMLYLVAAGAAVHPRLGDLAQRLAPPTHRLTWWRRDDKAQSPAA